MLELSRFIKAVNRAPGQSTGHRIWQLARSCGMRLDSHPLLQMIMRFCKENVTGPKSEVCSRVEEATNAEKNNGRWCKERDDRRRDPSDSE